MAAVLVLEVYLESTLAMSTGNDKPVLSEPDDTWRIPGPY
jgi:hypothetical protein